AAVLRLLRARLLTHHTAPPRISWTWTQKHLTPRYCNLSFRWNKKWLAHPDFAIGSRTSPAIPSEAGSYKRRADCPIWSPPLLTFPRCPDFPAIHHSFRWIPLRDQARCLIWPWIVRPFLRCMAPIRRRPAQRKRSRLMQLVNLAAQLWSDDCGAIITAEYMML